MDGILTNYCVIVGSNEVIEEEIHSQVENDPPTEQVVGKRKRKSWVWEHFDIVDDKESKTKIGICKHCKSASYNADSRRGTSNFSRHLLESCIEYKKVKSIDCKEPRKQIDQTIYRQLLAEAIMRHGYSFSWVEHDANRKIHKYLNEDVGFISRNTAKKVCLQLHTDLKEKIKSVLLGIPGKICLTSDIWTACTSRGYLCVTAHYVDHNWKLQSKLLCFSHCPPPHGGYELSQQVSKIITDWGIQNKVFSLSVDNATNMDKMVSYLRQGTLKDLICGGKHFHIRCCAHILNLIVKDGLDVIKSCVSKVREAVKYVDGSEGRIDKFFDCAKKLSIPFSFGLWLDVPTRWNSTYLMLDRAYKYRDALDNYFEEIHGGGKYILSFEEWAKIEKICNLLQPFYEVTKLFSGSDYPTANLYFPCVWKIHLQILRAKVCDDNDINRAATGMLDKFDKYWSDYVMVLAFGVIFDPRYKLNFVDHALKKVHGVIEGERKAREVQNQFAELYKEYEVLAGVGTSNTSNFGVAANHDVVDGDFDMAVCLLPIINTIISCLYFIYVTTNLCH